MDENTTYVVPPRKPVNFQRHLHQFSPDVFETLRLRETGKLLKIDCSPFFNSDIVMCVLEERVILCDTTAFEYYFESWFYVDRPPELTQFVSGAFMSSPGREEGSIFVTLDQQGIVSVPSLPDEKVMKTINTGIANGTNIFTICAHEVVAVVSEEKVSLFNFAVPGLEGEPECDLETVVAPLWETHTGFGTITCAHGSGSRFVVGFESGQVHVFEVTKNNEESGFDISGDIMADLGKTVTAVDCSKSTVAVSTVHMSFLYKVSVEGTWSVLGTEKTQVLFPGAIAASKTCEALIAPLANNGVVVCTEKSTKNSQYNNRFPVSIPKPFGVTVNSTGDVILLAEGLNVHKLIRFSKEKRLEDSNKHRSFFTSQYGGMTQGIDIEDDPAG